jgi:TRAP-type C4-dicarboxylate transport system substrate-binding protein
MKLKIVSMAAAASLALGAQATEFRSSDVHNSDDYPTVAAVKYMSDLIKQGSGGKHSIKVFNKGALGSERKRSTRPRSARSISRA